MAARKLNLIQVNLDKKQIFSEIFLPKIVINNTYFTDLSDEIEKKYGRKNVFKLAYILVIVQIES
jgi:hypothetical protein